MTPERLRQYRALCREIADLERRIDSSKVTDVVRASAPSFPYQSHTVRITGSDVRRTKRLQRLRARCRSERDEIERYIEQIEDSQMRLIFRFRYVDGMSWKRVAFAIGEHDEQFPRRKHNRYLKLDEKDEK